MKGWGEERKRRRGWEKEREEKGSRKVATQTKLIFECNL